ncbi:MAG: FliH/SctL family protein [Clostridium sp.]
MSSLSRSNNVLRNKEIHIDGKVSLKVSSGGEILSIPDRLIKEREDIENKIKQAKDEYEKILIELEEQKEKVISEANEQAKVIEKKAYESGYEQGTKNGYEDGFKEAYEKNVDKAIAESKRIREESYSTLLEIKSQAEDYIIENKRNILQMAITIAEQVLRVKFEEKDSMSSLLENVIKEFNQKKDLIIKVNPVYIEELQKNVKEMIAKFDLAQKIFVIPDGAIEKGNAEIETTGGRLTVGIDSVLEKVKAELL